MRCAIHLILHIKLLRHPAAPIFHTETVYFPCVRWFRTECDYLNLLGPSLEDLFNFYNRKFSLKTVLLLMDQLVSLVEVAHFDTNSDMNITSSGLANRVHPLSTLFIGISSPTTFSWGSASVVTKSTHITPLPTLTWVSSKPAVTIQSLSLMPPWCAPSRREILRKGPLIFHFRPILSVPASGVESWCGGGREIGLKAIGLADEGNCRGDLKCRAVSIRSGRSGVLAMDTSLSIHPDNVQYPIQFTLIGGKM
jgi:hypothetical protein